MLVFDWQVMNLEYLIQICVYGRARGHVLVRARTTPFMTTWTGSTGGVPGRTRRPLCVRSTTIVTSTLVTAGFRSRLSRRTCPTDRRADTEPGRTTIILGTNYPSSALSCPIFLSIDLILPSRTDKMLIDNIARRADVQRTAKQDSLCV